MNKKRRREPGFSLLANMLQKDVRTVRRWIDERPESRPLLRVRRHGKQWRIGYPKDQLEFEDWIEEVRQAVAAFTRTPERMGAFVKDGLEFLGFAGEESECKQRERDIEILRHALLLKRTSRKRDTQGADNEEQVEDNPPSFAEWESDALDYCSAARRVAAQFNCRVVDALSHWSGLCQSHREENRKSNAPKENWLKARGLFDRAQKLLPEAERPGELVAFIGATRADGRPRVKLYRFIPRWKSNRNGRWRRAFFQRETIQLLRVVTDEEIAAEFCHVKEIWPDPKHWHRARQQHEEDWRLKTLGEAALQLVQDGKPVNGSNLAPLLFRNQRTQDVWKSHQHHLELKRHGIAVFCDEETFCKNAKRGISLREFRQRYDKHDMANTKAAALKGDASKVTEVETKEAIFGTPAEDIEHDPEKDESGVGVRDERGEALTNATETEKDFASPETTLRVRRQLERSRAEVDALTQEERRKIEAALGRPLDDYMKKPFKEDFKPA